METIIQKNNYTFLKFIDFKNINLWDVKRYYNDFNFNFKISLRDIFRNYRKELSKNEIILNKIHIISKINFQGELFLRELDEIETYKGKLYAAPPNTIIYSKINLRHGCIYFNSTNKTIAVSNEYPVFEINNNEINGRFLTYLLRTSIIKQILNTKNTGISKSRIKVDEFLETKIPLPDLTTQEKLLQNYYAKIQLAENQEKQADELEKGIDEYLFKELGVEKNVDNNKIKGVLYFVNYKELERWDVWNKKNNLLSKNFDNLIFETIIIGKPQYGANVKSKNEISETRYIRITDINEDGTLNDEIVSPEMVEEKYLLNEGDFLIARSGNTVGKTFLYKNDYGKCLYAGYLIKFNLDTQKVLPEYILYYTKSSIYKNWINSNQRISGQPNINGQEYLQSPFIVPPLSKQIEISEQIKTWKAEIKSLREQAKSNRENAIKEFEEQLFI